MTGPRRMWSPRLQLILSRLRSEQRPRGARERVGVGFRVVHAVAEVRQRRDGHLAERLAYLRSPRRSWRSGVSSPNTASRQCPSRPPIPYLLRVVLDRNPGSRIGGAGEQFVECAHRRRSDEVGVGQLSRRRGCLLSYSTAEFRNRPSHWSEVPYPSTCAISCTTVRRRPSVPILVRSAVSIVTSPINGRPPVRTDARSRDGQRLASGPSISRSLMSMRRSSTASPKVDGSPSSHSQFGVGDDPTRPGRR